MLYVNNIVNVSPILHLILFADDTNIFVSHRDLPTIIRTLNVELKLLCNWFIVNRLSLNIDKTHFIVFNGIMKKYNCDALLSQKLVIDGKPISQVRSTKFLGVSIDKHLT